MDSADRRKARARRGRQGTAALQEKGQGTQPKSECQEVTGRSTAIPELWVLALERVPVLGSGPCHCSRHLAELLGLELGNGV